MSWQDEPPGTRPGGYLGPEGTPHYGGHLLPNLLLFGRVCKYFGMDVTPNRMIEVARALEFITLGRRDDFYHTLRALIVTHQRDLAPFDEAFSAFWRQPSDGWIQLDLKSDKPRQANPKPQVVPHSDIPSTGVPEDNRAVSERQAIVVMPTYSPNDALRRKDFAEMTAEEIALARHLMDKLEWGLGTRRSRRLQPGKGAILDVRRTIRSSIRSDGETLRLATARHKVKPRPLVLICDISGSMERYTRILLHFMHTLARSIYQVHSFVFSTRLTHITRAVRHKSVDAALHEVSQAVQDWGGGTRTGEALHTFNFRWARRVLGQGATVILITDGWDRGDPDQLKDEARRLQLNCQRLIWLNPLVGLPQYEPLTRGAQALLPFVDDFLPVRNLQSLDTLARELQRVDWHRARGTQVVPHAHLIIR